MQIAKRPKAADRIVVRTHGRGRKVRMRRKATPTFGRVTLRNAQESVNNAQKVAAGTVWGRLEGLVWSTRRVALSANWKVTIRTTLRIYSELNTRNFKRSRTLTHEMEIAISSQPISPSVNHNRDIVLMMKIVVDIVKNGQAATAAWYVKFISSFCFCSISSMSAASADGYGQQVDGLW